MKRSKGTYLQGLQYAETLLEQFIDSGQDPSYKFHNAIIKNKELPSYYYDGHDYCDGFYDYIHHFCDNKGLIIKHFKGED